MRKTLLLVLSFSLFAKADPSYEVVVVGGGVAGLATVHALSEQGVNNVLLLESEDRVGGKMWTERGLGTTYYERGAELVNTSDKELITLMKKLGLGLTERRFKREFRNEILMFKDRETGKVVPMSFEELLSKMHASAGDMSVLKKFHNLQENRVEYGKDIKKITARSLVEEGVYTKAFFEALAVSEFGKTLSELSAEVLLDYATVELSKEGKFNIEIIPGADEKFRVTNGTDSIISALENKVSNKIQKKSTVETVEQITPSQFNVKVKGQAQVIKAQHVVFAVPAYQLPKVNIISPNIKPQEIQKAANLPYAHNAKIFLVFNEKFWNVNTQATKKFDGVGILESGVQFWDTTEDQTKSKEGVITIYPGEWPVDQAAQEKRLAEILAELRAVPGLENLDQYLRKVDTQNWIKSYAGAFNPLYANANKLFAKDLPTNMYFVGADKDNNLKGEITESFGYMNGAVRTAERAVLSIKKHTKKMCARLF